MEEFKVNGKKMDENKKKRKLPLDGVKVIDFTRLYPGPCCTQILSDYGASVIKIEDSEKGDYNRWFKKDENEEYGAIFAALNSNKKSVAVNLKDRKERENIIKIIEKADVLLESFRPGVMKKFDLDYENVKNINSNIIYCSITGYGQSGKYRNKAGHDINFMSYAGVLNMMNFNFKNSTHNMMLPPFQLSDVVGSLDSVIAILLALQHREKFNEGQYIDISLMDSTLNTCLQCILPDYYKTNELQTEESNVLYGMSANYCVYRTADDRYLSVGALEDKFWREFCIGIGREDLIIHNREDELYNFKEEIQKVIEKKTLSDWMEIFKDLDACVTPVLKLNELENAEQIVQRRLIVNQEFGDGNIKVLNSPIKFSTINTKDKKRAPKLGENTNEFNRAKIYKDY